MTATHLNHDCNPHYHPFMIKAGSSTLNSRENNSHHIRKQTSRPSLPSTFLSYDERSTWWSRDDEQQERLVKWKKEDMQARGLLMTPKSQDDEELHRLWTVASSLLTRPPSALSFADQSRPDRRRRLTWGWRRSGRGLLDEEKVKMGSNLDPDSIAQGIVEYTESSLSSRHQSTAHPCQSVVERVDIEGTASGRRESGMTDNQRRCTMLACLMGLLMAMGCVVLACLLYKDVGLLGSVSKR